MPISNVSTGSAPAEQQPDASVAATLRARRLPGAARGRRRAHRRPHDELYCTVLILRNFRTTVFESEIWDISPSVETVLASNDSFLSLQSVTSPLRYGGAPLEYAYIANTLTVQISLAGPAPAYEERFYLNCTASGFFNGAYDELPESTYIFPGEAPSVTRITASLKWIDTTLTASCVVTIRDGPELPFFIATVTASASPVYECITFASRLGAFSAAFSSAIAYYGIAVGLLKYGLRFVVWLRNNFRRLGKFISAHGLFAALPRALRSGPKPVKLLGRFSVP